MSDVPSFIFFIKFCKNFCKSLFIFIFFWIIKVKKKSFECPKSIRNYEKKNLWTTDAWTMSHFSYRPSKRAYYIVDCRIFRLVKVVQKRWQISVELKRDFNSWSVSIFWHYQNFWYSGVNLKRIDSFSIVCLHYLHVERVYQVQLCAKSKILFKDVAKSLIQLITYKNDNRKCAKILPDCSKGSKF